MPTSRTIDVDWERFKSYLENGHGKGTTSIRLLYAKKYVNVLSSGNAQELLLLSDDKRMNVMKSMAVLSKFLGCYDRWKIIRERYQLKWSNDDSLKFFSNIFNSKENLTEMLSWLNATCKKIPKPYGNVLVYDALTGLRADEACNSIALIHSDLNNYMKDESMVLEHYKYPDKFIRRTKNAYISIAPDFILKIADESDKQGYNALRLVTRRRGLNMRMKYCRKIFGTYLRMNGVEPEIIDLLQGRIPKSVFARHYFRPDFEKKEIPRIRRLLGKLHKKIEA